jgi:hypothetical protein
MLAKLSIRAKLVAVVSLLLISLAAMGGFGLLRLEVDKFLTAMRAA